MGNGFTMNGADLDTVLVPRSYFNQGTLWTWGRNYQGTLGNNNTISQSSPVQTVAAGIDWKQIASSRYHSAGIKTDGTLWVWGFNNSGQLATNNLIQRSSPVQTTSGTNTWKQVTAGPTGSTFSGMTAAIKTDGSLWTWGRNTTGTLGDGTTINRSSPVLVGGTTGAGAYTWSQVSSTGAACYGIKTDGTLWGWGTNASGELGDNSTINRSSPVQTVAGTNTWRYVAGGTLMAAAIKTNGSLWTWGRNNTGALGDNTNISKSSPVQTVAGGNNWKTVAVGGLNQIAGAGFGSHTLAIKTDGTLWVWGMGLYGQLGTNTGADFNSPVQTVAGGTNWKSVSAGYFWSAAVKTDGTLWTWGANNYGQLGDNTVIRAFTPQQTVAGGYNWNLVSVGYTSIMATTWVYS